MSDRPSVITRFFRGIWRVVEFIRRVFVTLFVLGLVAIVWLAFAGRPSWTVEKNVALVWAPEGALVEAIDEAPEAALLQQISDARPHQTLVRDLITALDRAATDKRIRMVYLKLDDMDSAGMAQLQELAAAIRDFRRKSGKKVIAYSPGYTQEQYFLAAQADEVYMDPLGEVLLPGFGMYGHYFKEGLDKLGIDVHIFRVGEYKSAVEPFERNDMSPDAKAADSVWLNVMWDSYKKGVAVPRKLQPDAIEEYASHYPALVEANGGDLAQTAKASKLVDGLRSLDQIRTQVGAIVGMDDDNHSFRQIDQFSYLAATKDQKTPSPDAPSIAVAIAQGELIDGDSTVGNTGGDSMADVIDQAIEDDQVAALVLRIDSPGGSISAAERIRREVQRFRETNRPVVVSMSTLAASGGYWIAADADQIWAQDTTLTGSIGVFGLIPTFDKPLTKLGIHTDGVGTTAMSASFRGDMPMSPEVQRSVQLVVESDYKKFIGLVAKGRKMKPEDVDKIARGRVWSGADAKNLGLVDNVGGEHEAILAAAKLAGLEPDSYRLDVLEQPRDLTAELLKRFSLGFAGMLKIKMPAPDWIMAQVDQLAQLQSSLRWLNDPQGVYAHCMCRPSAGKRLH